MLTPNQISELLQIISDQNIVFISQKLGPDYLTSQEVSRLKNIGIDPSKIYSVGKDMVLNAFHFGLLADAIGKESRRTTFDQLKHYFKTGKHIPLTSREKYSLESIKRQFLGDIKSHEGRLFKDINGIISQSEKNNRQAYEDVIREEVERGKALKKVNSEIARDIARKTGDWSRDFGKIVEYISHQAFDEGRASMYERKYGEGVLVYKDVFSGACKYCVGLYLTKGFGSKPIIFTLKQLKENGTNIGRKAAEWKPVIGPTHPYCRCLLRELPESYDWNEEDRAFNIPVTQKRYVQPRVERKPIRVSFNNKEYLV